MGSITTVNGMPSIRPRGKTAGVHCMIAEKLAKHVHIHICTNVYKDI